MLCEMWKTNEGRHIKHTKMFGGITARASEYRQGLACTTTSLCRHVDCTCASLPQHSLREKKKAICWSHPRIPKPCHVIDLSGRPDWARSRRHMCKAVRKVHAPLPMNSLLRNKKSVEIQPRSSKRGRMHSLPAWPRLGTQQTL